MSGIYHNLKKMIEAGKAGLFFIDLDQEPGRLGLYDSGGDFLAGADFVPRDIRKDVIDSSKPGIRKSSGGRIYGELVAPVPVLVILGGGHIAKPLAEMGKQIGMKTWVVDDRKEFASPERFPGVNKLIAGEYREFFRKFQPGLEHFLVIVTRGHRHDLSCALEALQTRASYIGMIGSKRKVKEVFQKLKEEGFTEEDIRRIYAPIGLDIGAESPGEIAVSIVAEIIKVKKGKGEPGNWQEILPALQKGSMLATIVSASGSTPRGAGARLLLQPDGSTVGTVGGGLGEGKVIQKAREIQGSGSKVLLDFELDQDIAEEEGMICGGSFSVFIQPVE